MLWLKDNTDRIRILVKENSASSLTYAALECRLAIEQVCYERLRNSHDYISHKDLRGWQPKYVVTQLMEEVDPNVAETFTLSMSAEPIPNDSEDLTQSDFEKIEYTKVGTQIGFDSKKLGRLWNAVANFLHVTIPKNKDSPLSTYGDLDKLRRKINEVIEELDKISQGTLIMGGMGDSVSFTCECGSLNKRRSELLKEGQTVNCINQDCSEKFTVSFKNDDIFFKRRTVDINCTDCQKLHMITENTLLEARLNRVYELHCDCTEINYVKWQLMQGKNS